MADGRSRKAAATKKAAAVRSEARAARPRKVVDAAKVQPKMGIADPGFGRIVRVGARAAGKLAQKYGSSWVAYQKGSTNFSGPRNRVVGSSERLGARPKIVDPKPTKIRDSSPPTVKNPPPTKTFSGQQGPSFPGYVAPRVYKKSSTKPTSPPKTTSILKDPTARWQAGQLTRIAVGAPIARASGTGRAAKAAATKKKK